jgi:general secretion pathway protein G
MIKFRQQGFTLLELIVVIAIIGILATIALPALKDVPTRAKEAALKTDLRTMRDVINQYYGDKGHYPPTLESLVETGYLRAIPVDPITRSKDTWTVELEEQSPDQAPAETDQAEGGEPGIVDVHSGSERTTLDGKERYADW